jgi:hypothetical protein
MQCPLYLKMLRFRICFGDIVCIFVWEDWIVLLNYKQWKFELENGHIAVFIYYSITYHK